MHCPNCGESLGKSAKFCPNCGVALATVLPQAAATGLVAARPIAPFILCMVGVVGMVADALSMSFIDDAPGDIGSPIASLFHSVGVVQLILGLGVLTSAVFLMMKVFDAELLGGVILALGLVSVASLLLLVVEGTFAVIFLAIPGLLVVAAGVLARRTAKP